MSAAKREIRPRPETQADVPAGPAGRASTGAQSRGTAAPPRRIEKPPAAAMVLAPVLGLFLWGGLAALVLL